MTVLVTLPNVINTCIYSLLFVLIGSYIDFCNFPLVYLLFQKNGDRATKGHHSRVGNIPHNGNSSTPEEIAPELEEKHGSLPGRIKTIKVYSTKGLVK